MPNGQLMSVPDLEACVGQVVKVHESTAAGVVVTEGRVKLVQVPWQIDLTRGTYGQDGVWRPESGEWCTFAGTDTGIVKIECNGKTVYANTTVPVPYPQFVLVTDNGLAALNALRRNCFGEGFDYIRGPSA